MFGRILVPLDGSDLSELVLQPAFELAANFGAQVNLLRVIAAQCCIELIVMSTHGRSGLNRFLYGSVAEAVLRGANRPLLLMPVR